MNLYLLVLALVSEIEIHTIDRVANLLSYMVDVLCLCMFVYHVTVIQCIITEPLASGAIFLFVQFQYYLREISMYLL